MSLLNFVDIPLAIVLATVTSLQGVDLNNYNKGALKLEKQPDNLQVLVGPGVAPQPLVGVQTGAMYVFGDNIAIWRPIVGTKYFSRPASQTRTAAEFVWAGGGLQYEKELFRFADHPVFLDFSVMLGPHYGTSRYKLGGVIAANVTTGLAIDISKSLRVSFSYDHISNGYTARPNFGLEGLLLGVTYKF